MNIRSVFISLPRIPCLSCFFEWTAHVMMFPNLCVHKWTAALSVLIGHVPCTLKVPADFIPNAWEAGINTDVLSAYHVLLRCYELYASLRELGPLVVVHAFSLSICCAEVLRWALTYHAAQIALKSPAAALPAYAAQRFALPAIFNSQPCLGNEGQVLVGGQGHSTRPSCRLAKWCLSWSGR